MACTHRMLFAGLQIVQPPFPDAAGVRGRVEGALVYCFSGFQNPLCLFMLKFIFLFRSKWPHSTKC